MASTQPAEAVDLFVIRHAAIRPWPGTIFPHTPVYLGFARYDGLFEIVDRRLHIGRGFLEIVRAFGADLVFMGLHAIDDAAFAGRDGAAIFLDIVGAGTLNL